MSNFKVGLVLSGGGAKGAYHVGVLKALLELDAQIDAVAGASIGALNAAVLASSPSLEEGVNRLDELWRTLADSSPLTPNFPAYLNLLIASGLKMGGVGLIGQVVGVARSAGLNIPIGIDSLLDEGLLSNNPLHKLMDQYLDHQNIKNGMPLFVSVFKSNGPILDILNVISADLGLADSPDSEFMHIQALPESQQKEVLLASAAIPLLFAPRQVNNTIYRDGGMGGWQKMQGNTPLTPLLESGIKTVLVTHLSDGSLWSRKDFPDATVLEIRPQSSIQRDGGVKDLLGFDPHKIPSWIQQGYKDTIHCVGRVKEAVSARDKLFSSEILLAASEAPFASLDALRAEAKAQLR